MAMVHDPPSSFNSGQSFDGLDLPNHKRLSRVNIDEESQLNGSPQTTSSGWSHFPGKLSRVGTAKIQPNLSKSSSWALEVVSLLLATGAMIAMVVLLAQYDDHPLPEWPHDITFNAMIALLATLMTVTLAVPMSNSLSQLKWIRFNTKSSPLTDMELFDDASRGTWGSALLLAKLRGGYLGSFGAFVAVLTLAVQPFSQQVATYKPRMVSTAVGATNLRSPGYELALGSASSQEGFIPILPLKAAVYNGLFAEDGKPLLKLPVNCLTGNCTWEPFETLGVCNKCVDMTEFMDRYCESKDDDDDDKNDQKAGCGWSLPSGAVLNTSAEVFSMHSFFPSEIGDMSFSTIMKLVFMGTEEQDGLAGKVVPWARQCTLEACVQTIESRVVNGAITEKVVSSVANDSIPTEAAKALEPILINDAKDEQQYPLGMQAMLGFRSWFQDLFVNGSASRNQEYINNTITSSDSIVANLTVGISKGETFFDNDIVQAFYWNYYEYKTGIDMLVDDLAISMTVSFRSLMGEEVKGISLSEQSFVRVEWGFIVVPMLAVVLTGIFLALTIWRTHASKSQLWKSSIIATLVHGLDDETREKLEEHDGLPLQREQAKSIKVQLKVDELDEKRGLLQSRR